MTKKQLYKKMQNDLKVAIFSRDKAAKENDMTAWGSALGEIHILERYMEMLKEPAKL